MMRVVIKCSENDDQDDVLARITKQSIVLYATEIIPLISFQPRGRSLFYILAIGGIFLRILVLTYMYLPMYMSLFICFH